MALTRRGVGVVTMLATSALWAWWLNSTAPFALFVFLHTLIAVPVITMREETR